MKKKKEELHEEKHKSRLDLKITFDFAGRRVVEEDHKVLIKLIYSGSIKV